MASASGAGTGAAIGSVVPGIGTAIGGIVGGLAGLFGGGGGPSEEELIAMGLLDENGNIAESIPDYILPALNFKPDRYSTPESAAASTVTEDPNLRNAQMAALQSLLTRSNEGVTAEEARATDLSRRKQGETTRGQEEAIINNMAARGVGGSGMEYAMRQAAAQNAGETATQEGLAREATNAEQKRLALGSLLSGTAGVRNQDYTANKGNTDITNDFALENSRRRNAVNQLNTELSNKAQLANKTDAQTRYQDKYNADIQKRKMQQDSNTQRAQALYGQDIARTDDRAQTIGNIGTVAKGIGSAWDYFK